MQLNLPYLLFIEPAEQKDSTPIIDDLTKKMTAAFRKAEAIPPYYHGFHECICGATSKAHNFQIQNTDLIVNSLCIHYLAWHRTEIPQENIDIITSLPEAFEEPTEEEIQ